MPLIGFRLTDCIYWDCTNAGIDEHIKCAFYYEFGNIIASQFLTPSSQLLSVVSFITHSASAGGNTGNNNSNGQNVADQTEAAQRYLQSISQALLSGSLSGNSGQVNAVPFGPPPPPNKKPTSVTVNVAGGQSTTFDIDGSDLSPESAAGVQSLGLQLEALSALMSQATSSSTPTRQQQQQSSPGRNRNRNSSRSGNRGSSQPFNMAEMAAGTGATPAQAQKLYDMLSNSSTTDAEKLESLMKLKHNPNSPAARDSDANRAANFQQLLSMVSSSASSLPAASSMTQDDDQIPDMSNLSSMNDSLNALKAENMDLKAQEQALMALCSAGMNLGIKKGIKDSMRDAKNNRKKGGGGGGNNNQQPKLDSEDISGLLPIFTQLVELTNSIVSSQDEEQTDELCKKALGMNAAMNGGKVFLPPGSINMAKDVFESNVEGANRGKKMSQAEAMEKVAALTASMAQQPPQQGGGSGKRSSSNSNSATSASMPLFQMMFGGPNNNQGNNNNNSMNNNNVPPIPPPSGGWPQGSGPAAAAAAAMAAFATSMTDGSSNNTQAGGQQPPNYVDPNMPFPNMPQSSNNAEADSAAWLDYYDACLRARGVKGGIAEFEAFAQLSSQGAAVTAQMQSMGLRPGGGGMMKDDESDSLPAGFEYDAKQQAKSNELSQQEILALEAEAAEKSAKKAAKKREKKARQKERAKKEAEAKAAEAAKKKREKAIVSWRSRVVAACSGNGDAKKMEALVGSESPYKNYIYDPSTENPTTQEEDDENADNEEPMTHEEYLADQLDWFLQACLQKYSNSPSSIQKQPFANNLAREKLLKYIVSQSMDVILYQSADNNFRNAIHEAAYNNDANFIKWIIESQSSDDKKPDDNSSYIDLLEGMCEDGGWTPLHYAVAGGASNVVELLMAKGVSVSSRTDRNKTCFNTGIRRRGNGVTPRELAIVLQSGAVDDDLKSDAAILDDCVENRIEEVSSTDKATYMRILKSLEDRLASVEKNGYTPPPKKGGMLTIGTGNKSSGTEVQDQQRTTTEATLSSSAGSKKSKKKKKKKEVPVQQTNAKTTAAQAPVAILKPPASKPAPPLAAEEVQEEDLSDPVAVALLGMGFTEDQIKSAARALGGFERATADDMVMWILGGGEIVSSTPRQSNAAVVEQDKPSSNPVVAAASMTPSGDSAVLTKAQKKAAAKAKRETEDAARKLQEEQAAAQRAAAKKEEQRRIRRQWNEREQARHEQEKNAKIAEQMERRRRADMEKKMMMPPGVGGPPMSVQIPGGGRPGGPGGMTINLGGPKMPPPPTKAKGSNMGIPQAPTVRGAPKILARPSAAGIPPKPSMGGQVGSQSLFTGGARKPGSPPRSINTNAKPFKPAGHQPVAILSKSGVGAQRSSAAPRHPHAPQAAEYHPSTGYTTGSQMSTSSAGSASSSYIEANPTGNIRATAREFVPTFLPKPTANEFVPSSKPAVVSSMSAQPTTGVPAPVSPLPPTQTTSNDNNSADELVVPMASLLSSFGVDTNVLPSTVGNKGQDSNIPSAASSITGLSGLQPTGEDNLTSRVGSALTFESNLGGGAAGGLQTSSILESIQYGGDQNTGSSTLGSGIGLWGGGATTSNANQTTSLAGLNFSSFMGSGDATNTNNSNGNNNAAPGRGNTWGANTGGSIW